MRRMRAMTFSIVLAAGAAGWTAAGGAQSSGRGQEVFERRCTGCHALDRDKEGPRLSGVVGRKAGSVTSFEYSEALKNSGIVWSTESLDKWLQDPAKLVPDNDMAFHVESAAERADIIDYLQRSAGK